MKQFSLIPRLIAAVVVLLPLTTSSWSAPPIPGGAPPSGPNSDLPPPPPPGGTNPIPPPAAPSDLTATNVTPTGVTLWWRDNASNEQGHRLMCRHGGVLREVAHWGPQHETARAPFAKKGVPLTGWMTCRDTGVCEGDEHTYWVEAFGTYYEGKSTSNIIRVQIPPGPPSATDFRVYDAKKRSLTVSWKDNSTHESRFVLERRRDQPPSSWQQIRTFERNGASAAATGEVITYLDEYYITPDTSYLYRIRSDTPCSRYSEVASGRTLALQPPAAPSDLRVVSTTPRAVTLAWRDNANNETGYKVQHYGWTTTDGWDSLPANSQSHTVSGLISNHAYTFKVKAINADGESAEVTVQTRTPADNAGGGGGNGRPDIVVPDTWAEPNEFPSPGQAFTVFFHVCNAGSVPTGAFVVRLVRDNGDHLDVDEESLAPGACREVSWPLSGLPNGDHWVEAQADPLNQVAEGNEYNNNNHHGFGVQKPGGLRKPGGPPTPRPAKSARKQSTQEKRMRAAAPK